MESVVDLFSARPGERFRFRMIGRPKAWLRIFLDDGTHVDHEDPVQGIDSHKVFGSFATDRDDNSLSLVIMPYELASRLSAKFKIVGVVPGASMSVDVDISIIDNEQRYFIDIGKISELPNSDIIARMNELWDTDVVEFDNTAASSVSPKSVVEWVPPKWPFVDVDDIDTVIRSLDGDDRKVLVSMMLRVVDMNDEDISITASRILRAIRMNEE